MTVRYWTTYISSKQ